MLLQLARHFSSVKIPALHFPYFSDHDSASYLNDKSVCPPLLLLCICIPLLCICMHFNLVPYLLKKSLYASKYGKHSSGHWKSSVFIPIPKKGNAKDYSNYHTIVLISHARKLMLKIFQARLQQYVNQELPDVQARFRKGRGTRDQTSSVHWFIEKAREF